MKIQGVLALENVFNRVGLDHVLLVRIASTAVVTRLIGGTRDDVICALANAFIDGGALRTYRHAPTEVAWNQLRCIVLWISSWDDYSGVQELQEFRSYRMETASFLLRLLNS